MSNDGINLSRRKVLGGITTVGAASAAAGAGTFALFSDSSKTGSQTISTGTVNFQNDSPTALDITAENQGSTGSISGSTTFTYDGSKNATFVIGMALNDVDDDSAELAQEIELNSGTKITVEDPDNDQEVLNDDPITSGMNYSPNNLNTLSTDSETPTLADLESELKTDESDQGLETITTEDGSTVDAIPYWSGLEQGQTVTLSIDGEWNDLGNEFQDQEIGVTVYGKVREPETSS